jgi:Zn-dependent metalloprotease
MLADQFISYQCIIPPHMLRNIVEKGSTAQRMRALDSLSTSEQLRGQRQALMALQPQALAGTEVMQRTVYTADNSTNLPGREVRTEGQPSAGDAAADEAYDGSGATYNFYLTAYQRNSINGNGMALKSTVHYGQGYDNAFWNGQQMVYGDGDEDLPESQRLFNRFTIAVDIIGHELTHGVTQYESRLAYQGQSGALNESLSDVFGVLVKQMQLNQEANQADWIIGAGLFTGNVNGVGIRSMKAPGTAYDDPLLGKDPQPSHMNDYKEMTSDNGGVHINSGIPNHAFYVTAIEIGGYAWEKAGKIWYAAQCDKLNTSSDFQQAANTTYQTAGELFGTGSLEQQAVRKGWDEVGIQVDGTSEKGSCLTAAASMFMSLIKRINIRRS